MAVGVPMKLNLPFDFDVTSAPGDEPLKVILQPDTAEVVQVIKQSFACQQGALACKDSGIEACSTAASTCSEAGSDTEVSTAKTLQTSLMIRNVPVLYSKEMLLAEWPNEGDFDFFHLPWNAETQRNLSYAFINFTSEDAALRFVQRWQKQRLPHYSSRKPLNISFADVQGLAENLLQLQRKRVNLEQCGAVVFEAGRRVCLKDAMRAVLRPCKKQATSGASFKHVDRRAPGAQPILEGQIFAL